MNQLAAHHQIKLLPNEPSKIPSCTPKTNVSAIKLSDHHQCIVDLLLGDVLMRGESDNFLSLTFTDGEISALITQISRGVLQMNRYWIMYFSLDPSANQELNKLVTASCGYQVKLINLTKTYGTIGWTNKMFEPFQSVIEKPCIADSRLDQVLDRIKYPTTNHGLKRLQTVINTPNLDMIAIHKTMITI